MKIRQIASGILALSLFPAVAFADHNDTRVVVVRPRAQQTLQLGGGVNNFTTGFDNITKPGGAYDVRAAFGVRNPLGVELAYVGSLNDLKGTITSVDGTSGSGNRLMSNGGEALLRANFGGNGDIIPYVGAGLGVTDSRIIDDGGKTISVKSGAADSNRTFGGSSTDFHVPAAAGVDAFINDRVTLGARAGYKYDFRNGLRTDVAKADIQSWQATARLGVAF